MSRLRLNNLRIAPRLALGFGLVTVLLIVIALMSWRDSSSARANDQQTNANLVSNGARERLLVDALRVGLDENSVAADYEGHVTAAADLASFQADTRQFSTDYASDQDRFDPTELALRAQAMKAFNTYLSLSDGANAAFVAGHGAKALALVAELSDGSIVTPVQGLLNHQSTQTLGNNDAAITAAGNDGRLAIGFGLAAVVLAAGLAMAIIRSIAKPLAVAVDVLDASADGDVTVRAPSIRPTSWARWASRSTANWNPARA